MCLEDEHGCAGTLTQLFTVGATVALVVVVEKLELGTFCWTTPGFNITNCCCGCCIGKEAAVELAAAAGILRSNVGPFTCGINIGVAAVKRGKADGWLPLLAAPCKKPPSIITLPIMVGFAIKAPPNPEKKYNFSHVEQ